MRKLIMFVFFVLSLVAIIGITMSLNDLLSFLNLGNMSLEDIQNLFETSTVEEIIQELGTIIYTLMQVYGIPIITFLISLNGMAISKR